MDYKITDNINIYILKIHEIIDLIKNKDTKFYKFIDNQK